MTATLPPNVADLQSDVDAIRRSVKLMRFILLGQLVSLGLVLAGVVLR